MNVTVIEISGSHTASLKMTAFYDISMRLHGTISQKAVIFITVIVNIIVLRFLQLEFNVQLQLSGMSCIKC
jgi:hypothetical protein